MLYRSVLCTAAALLSCGAAHATPIRQSAGAVQQVLVASDTDVQIIANNCNSGFADIPGAFVKITIPSGANQLLVARFTGQVNVGQASGFASASVRIVIGARELNPAGGPTVVASSADPFTPPVAIQRSGPIAQGAHLVKVQACVSGDNTASGGVAGWHFTVEAAPLQ